MSYHSSFRTALNQSNIKHQTSNNIKHQVLIYKLIIDEQQQQQQQQQQHVSQTRIRRGQSQRRAY
jgi:hypothetical protein